MTIPLMEEDPELKVHYENFSPMDENEIIDSSQGTIAVLDSIRNGDRITF